MANRAPSTECKSAADQIKTLLADHWASVLVVHDGKVDYEETKRAFGIACLARLRATGDAPKVGAKGPQYNVENVTSAAIVAFCKQVKEPTDRLALGTLEWLAIAVLAPAPEEGEKCKRAIHAVLTDEHGPFRCIRPEGKFAGVLVEIKPESFPKVPPTFVSWAEGNAAKAAAKADAPVAKADTPALAPAPAAEVKQAEAPAMPTPKAATKTAPAAAPKSAGKK